MNHQTRNRFLQAGLFILIVFIVASLNPAYAAAQTPGAVDFNSQTINRTPPEEAVRQIELRSGGGLYPGCMGQPEEPYVHFKTDYLELTGIAIIATCGWQPDEAVQVTMSDPSGKVFTTEVTTAPARYKKDVYQAIVYFQPGLDAPEGKYRFTFQGSQTEILAQLPNDSGGLKTKVEFSRPQAARMYVVAEDSFQPHFGAVGGQSLLRLSGFLPGEPVRLLAYQFEGNNIQFYGWQDYVTDGAGMLDIQTNLSDVDDETEMNYYAWGLETHFVQLERFTMEGYSLTRRFDMDLYCPGAEEPRLSGARELRAAPGEAALVVRQQPGFGSRVIAESPAETPVRVFDYPKCIDHAFWWKVSLKEPVVFGWVPESFLGKYVVQPGK